MLASNLRCYIYTLLSGCLQLLLNLANFPCNRICNYAISFAIFDKKLFYDQFLISLNILIFEEEAKNIYMSLEKGKCKFIRLI